MQAGRGAQGELGPQCCTHAEETPAPVPPGGCYQLLPREPEWAAMTESEKKLKINRMRRKSRSGGGKQSGSHPPALLPSI